MGLVSTRGVFRGGTMGAKPPPLAQWNLLISGGFSAPTCAEPPPLENFLNPPLVSGNSDKEIKEGGGGAQSHSLGEYLPSWCIMLMIIKKYWIKINIYPNITRGRGGLVCDPPLGQIPFTGRLPAFSMDHAPLNPNTLPTSIHHKTLDQDHQDLSGWTIDHKKITKQSFF